jgi:5,5'-dehydrodivanillate O-demethylase
MLSAEQNELMTRVGPGTPMGEVMRRYWYPVALTSDLETWPVKKVRLLGEDFALFKGKDGKYGIMQERCPHRAASLVYGIVEECGLRCGYHGWAFDRDGTCTDMPAEPEDSQFKNRITVFAGKAEEMGGLVWAYIGPSPAPELPRFDVYVMNGWRDIGHCTIPCNWLQIMENSVDPHHVEWLHGQYFEFLGRQQGFDAPKTFQRRHAKVAFDEFEFGINKRRLYVGQSEDSDDWKVGHPVVFPYTMRVGGAGAEQMQIRVPIDDTTTWWILYTCHAPLGDASTVGPDGPIPAYEIPWIREDGTYVTDYVEGQDIMVWVTQGAIADRTQEHIGTSDVGVIKLRRMFKEALAKVEAGEDPPAVVRYKHDRIDLPCEKDKFGAGPAFIRDWIKLGFSRYSPQVDLIKKLYDDAFDKSSS